MFHKRLWSAAAIIAVVVFIGFVLSVPHTKELPTEKLASDAQTNVPEITLSDSFRKGVHSFTGSVLAPDACTQVQVAASLEGDASSSQRILIALAMPEASGVCLQVPTRVPFNATLAAPQGLPISLTLNGVLATTTAP